jgi:hypothetical protein
VATLFVSGPGFMEHINCTPSAGVEGWYLEGLANPVDETVTFVTCNQGSFTAQGTVSYGGGTLNGSVTCLYTQGSVAGQVAILLTLP